MRKNWHPASWSEQARQLADRFWTGYSNKEEGLAALKNSYRAPIIRYRAIERYVRKMEKEGLR